MLEAVTRMETSKLGIILVVDEDRKLVGTITDGDVRRAVLRARRAKGRTRLSV